MPGSELDSKVQRKGKVIRKVPCSYSFSFWHSFPSISGHVQHLYQIFIFFLYPSDCRRPVSRDVAPIPLWSTCFTRSQSGRRGGGRGKRMFRELKWIFHHSMVLLDGWRMDKLTNLANVLFFAGTWSPSPCPTSSPRPPTPTYSTSPPSTLLSRSLPWTM